MTIQMNDFLTIEEAVKLTNTSESTVRRFIKSLPEDRKRKVIKKEGKRILIAKEALQEGFDLLPGAEDVQSVELVNFQRQQLQEGAKLTSRLTDQNERLLTELQKTSEDLKSAWSLIDHLKSEVFRLTAEVKRLEAPSTSKADRVVYYFAVALCLIVIAVLVFVLL